MSKIMIFQLFLTKGSLQIILNKKKKIKRLINKKKRIKIKKQNLYTKVLQLLLKDQRKPKKTNRKKKRKLKNHNTKAKQSSI